MRLEKMKNLSQLASLVSAILFFSTTALAQLPDNRAFITPLYADSSQARQLRFRAETFFFNKDNEYFWRIADGYTLFGVAARPQLTWQPTARIKLAGGVFFRQDFGGRRVQQVRPAITLVVQGDSWRFLFGSLDGHLHHALAEPLYDFERVMVQRPEEGIQLTGTSGPLRYDAWVNWEKMQYRRDSVQEVVSGGFSGLIDLIDGKRGHWDRGEYWRVPGTMLTRDDPGRGHRFGLRIPVQFTGKHIGGQIDTVDKPLQTYFNGATGLRLLWINPRNFSEEKPFVRGARLEALGNGFLDYSFTRRLPFKNGRGLLLSGGIQTKLGSLWASYWRSDGFIADAGGSLYQSLGRTVNYPGHVERHREVVIVRLENTFHLWKNGFLVSRTEPYYDLLNKRFEFNLGLYLTGLFDERLR